MIIYLSSTDQAAQDTALIAAGICQIIEQPVLDAEGNQTFHDVVGPDTNLITQVLTTTPIVVPIYGYTVDTVGTIYAPDTSGGVYTLENPYVPVAMSGWYCNLMGSFTPEQLALLPTIPTPNNPMRMFAGAGK